MEIGSTFLPQPVVELAPSVLPPRTRALPSPPAPPHGHAGLRGGLLHPRLRQGCEQGPAGPGASLRGPHPPGTPSPFPARPEAPSSPRCVAPVLPLINPFSSPLRSGWSFPDPPRPHRHPGAQPRPPAPPSPHRCPLPTIAGGSPSPGGVSRPPAPRGLRMSPWWRPLEPEGEAEPPRGGRRSPPLTLSPQPGGEGGRSHVWGGGLGVSPPGGQGTGAPPLPKPRPPQHTSVGLSLLGRFIQRWLRPLRSPSV